jgi:hypothetical protein
MCILAYVAGRSCEISCPLTVCQICRSQLVGVHVRRHTLSLAADRSQVSNQDAAAAMAGPLNMPDAPSREILVDDASTVQPKAID